MRTLLVDALSLLTAVTGWYYLFYSRAAGRLAGLESRRLNRRRRRLRRAGGVVMLLLAVGFFAGFNSVDAVRQPTGYLVVWAAVMLLLIVMVILALADVRLTAQLRRSFRDGERP